MNTILIEAKNVEELAGKTKNDIVEGIISIDREYGSKTKEIEQKLKNKEKYNTIFCIEDGVVWGYLCFVIKKKYIEINRIKIKKGAKFQETLNSLIDNLRIRPAYKKFEWMRIWVLQDFENIELSKALCKYGFSLFPDKNDLTRFYFKEKEKKDENSSK